MHSEKILVWCVVWISDVRVDPYKDLENEAYLHHLNVT